MYLHQASLSASRLASLLAALIALSGCASQYASDRGPFERQPAQQPGDELLEEPPRPVILPSATTAPAEPVRSLPAAMALREQAGSAADAGNHQQAISLLERALRISPQDPETFIALAQNNMAMDQMQQAMQLARRGLTLNPTGSQRQTLQRIVDEAQAAL